MNLPEVMARLAALGTAATKKTFLRHGAVEPLFGVKIGDLKPLQKQLKGRQDLALALYDTTNSDAMYLAGLLADGSKMTIAQLRHWADTATWPLIASCPVAWVAAEHPDGFSLAREWIASTRPITAIAGWSTLAALATTRPDDSLPIPDFQQILDRLERDIHHRPDPVRYQMNGFLIACGTYVAPLADAALALAERLGKIEIDMGDTACKVPDAAAYMLKARKGAKVAPKRKTVRC